jgi:Amt family ammonium transporter
VIGADKISAGDSAWMLRSTALVLMMCLPGLALFYGGMVRTKNVLATLMQSFACACVVTILWWLIGCSWAFTPGNGFIGGSGRALFNGMTYVHGETDSKLSVSQFAPTIPETVYAMFQMTFAIITPARCSPACSPARKSAARAVRC